jgi:signal transduction protein with GAF and PtsI domain
MPNHHTSDPSGSPTDIGHEYFRALYRVVTAVNSSLHLHTVLNLVAEKVAEAMNVKASSLRLLDRMTDTLTISAMYGLSQQYMQKGPVQLEKSQLDQEALQGQAVYIRDAATDPRFQYPEEARAEGIVSVFCVPLICKGQALGVLRVYSGVERHFDAFDEEFLRTLASVSALAIENARLYGALKQDFDETILALWGEPSVLVIEESNQGVGSSPT